ncbi:hypothetical protein [Mycolicibacterium sp. 018/SC-01/001]|uniref:hypothetical protein n=1 Tax=Mycolicibacterium sp. 018/SC-01/001 TaxID=2592069 RepID=UPI002103DB09|nr:hypothetical protein [Mycolicibacterium sp. 018/SC-01/001]
MPVAHASPLDAIRVAVNVARSQTSCGPLNYNIDLEGNAQAVAGNTAPGVPPAGRYRGKVAEARMSGDPTSEATEDLINQQRPLIANCSYKDFGVGMRRSGNDEFSVVGLSLGEPAAVAPPPPPRPEPAPAPAPAPPAPVETAPTNAVTLNIVREGLRAKVTVGNTSNLQAQCTYNAREVNGLGLPISRDFGVNPKGTTPLEFAAPLIGQTYTVVVSCRADFKGQNVEIGRVQQDFSSL